MSDSSLTLNRSKITMCSSDSLSAYLHAAAAASLAGVLVFAPFGEDDARTDPSSLIYRLPHHPSASISQTGSELGRKKLAELRDSIIDAAQLATDPDYDGEVGSINAQTWSYTLQFLVPTILESAISVPLLLPLQRGGISAEWHELGLNIEMRFRRPYDVWAVLEDARGVIARHQGRDPNLAKSRQALEELRRRSQGLISAG